MHQVVYTVAAFLPDDAVRQEYVRWLQDGHTAAVVRGGALAAEVVLVLEPAAPPQVITRYVFPDRAAYDRYVAEVAPALRAEGVQRFGTRGVRFERTLGTIL
ncbi:MAG: DUF4286 family protein [Planctomycetota bacterium]|nr:DUF4286 family protein [Planctomycetota bacterium]